MRSRLASRTLFSRRATGKGRDMRIPTLCKRVVVAGVQIQQGGLQKVLCSFFLGQCESQKSSWRSKRSSSSTKLFTKATTGRYGPAWVCAWHCLISTPSATATIVSSTMISGGASEIRNTMRRVSRWGDTCDHPPRGQRSKALPAALASPLRPNLIKNCARRISGCRKRLREDRLVATKKWPGPQWSRAQ
jgi:hypothetical protein